MRYCEETAKKPLSGKDCDDVILTEREQKHTIGEGEYTGLYIMPTEEYIELRSMYEKMVCKKTPRVTLNSFAAEIHQNAVDHGWWGEDRTLPEILMLCVSELSEALEQYRDAMPSIYYSCGEGEPRIPCSPKDGYDCVNYADTADCPYQQKKPEGVAVELADCIIRILDYCGYAGIDIESVIRAKHEYNKARPYRHGGKKC